MERWACAWETPLQSPEKLGRGCVWRELELQFGQLVDRSELERENLLFHVLTCTKLKWVWILNSWHIFSILMNGTIICHSTNPETWESHNHTDSTVPCPSRLVVQQALSILPLFPNVSPPLHCYYHWPSSGPYNLPPRQLVFLPPVWSPSKSILQTLPE